jgi:hypothetical protein
MFERRLAALEAHGRPEVSGPTELSVEDRSHDDGLEFLRVWIDGHFDNLELDSPTLSKIKQMIDVIGTKMRRRKAK